MSLAEMTPDEDDTVMLLLENDTSNIEDMTVLIGDRRRLVGASACRDFRKFTKILTKSNQTSRKPTGNRP